MDPIKSAIIAFCMLILLQIAAASCDFPNNTANSMHWWPCSNGSLQFSNFTLQNLNGTEEYPLNPSKTLMLTAELVNNGKTYSRIRNNMDVWLFGGWFECSWVKIPTFGLLENRDACASGVPCPIRPGRQRLRVPLDFTNYTALTKLLKNDASYQIRYAIVDGETGQTDCVFMQIRVKSE